MFNFEVLNLEVDCKEAEQNLLELFFKLDHDQLTLILLSHLLWRFQSETNDSSSNNHAMSISELLFAIFSYFLD